MQLYAQTPYGDYERQHGVEKSAIQLAGFGKTQELAPGASETVTITVDKYLLASYDTTAHDGAGGYILSDGDYYLAIGEDSHDALNNVLAAEGYTAANGMTARALPPRPTASSRALTMTSTAPARTALSFPTSLRMPT